MWANNNLNSQINLLSTLKEVSGQNGSEDSDKYASLVLRFPTVYAVCFISNRKMELLGNLNQHSLPLLIHRVTK